MRRSQVPHARPLGRNRRPAPCPPRRPGSRAAGPIPPGARSAQAWLLPGGASAAGSLRVTVGLFPSQAAPSLKRAPDCAPQGTYLPGAQPQDGHLCAGVEHEVVGHDCRAPLTPTRGPCSAGCSAVLYIACEARRSGGYERLPATQRRLLIGPPANQDAAPLLARGGVALPGSSSC